MKKFKFILGTALLGAILSFLTVKPSTNANFQLSDLINIAHAQDENGIGKWEQLHWTIWHGSCLEEEIWDCDDTGSLTSCRTWSWTTDHCD